MYARYVCTVCMHGMYARYVCTVCMHGMYARYVYTVCIHGMYARYVCTVCMHGMYARYVYTVCIHGMYTRYVYTVCIHTPRRARGGNRFPFGWGVLLSGQRGLVGRGGEIASPLGGEFSSLGRVVSSGEGGKYLTFLMCQVKSSKSQFLNEKKKKYFGVNIYFCLPQMNILE